MLTSRGGPQALRFPLGGSAPATPAWANGVPAGLLVLCAVACALAPWSVGARAALSLAVVALAGLVHHGFRRKQRAPLGWLLVDTRGIHRIERDQASTIADFTEPLGVTVFASVDRAVLRVALTSPRSARYVTACVRDAGDAEAAHSLVERAVTVADEDLRGGSEWSLSAADAERFVNEVVRRVPGALDRVYLSDATGAPIVLERTELWVGGRRIDLSAPLEWRASLFQELGAYVVSVCQATWIRQADVEVVLVASVPGEGARVRDADEAIRAAGDEPIVRRMLARDVRLMQASVAEPPPRELRFAIDRTFMLALRHALDRAPRGSRASLPSLRSSQPDSVAGEKLG